MFEGIEKIKNKNIFAICNAVSAERTVTRSSLGELSSLSYQTVSKAVELLLDLGIITERQKGKNYVYSFKTSYYFAIADLRGSFHTVFTDIGGRELFSLRYNESGAFFFDEKVSMFLRDSSIIAARRFPRGKLKGVGIILPSADEAYRDTRSILLSEKRLKRLISAYFHETNIITLKGIEGAARVCMDKRGLIIMKEQDSVYLSAVGYGTAKAIRIKSVASTKLGECRSSEELAKVLACAVGNISELLSPEVILVDGDRMFAVSAFPARFKSTLAVYTCISEQELPNICHYDGSLALLGTAALLRDDLILSQLDTYENKSHIQERHNKA
ncbi:MAG: hypothetical protein IJ457_08585 [Clostridia bacterium]|nr:hypothetical protein [Clostridia bacterium]